MPFIVTMRPSATREIEIPEQSGLDSFNAAVLAALPDGHDLVVADYKRSVAVVRPRRSETVTINDRTELASCIPDGWQALSIRPA